MSTSLEDLTPDTKELAIILIEKAQETGLRTRIISTLRTCEEQNNIYAQGRTAPGAIVTKASGCRSWHVWGRAIDLLIVDDDGKPVTNGTDPRYDILGEIGKELGFIWGGEFSWGRDAVHFEYHPGVIIGDICPDPNPEMCQEQLARHNAQNVPPSTDPVPVTITGDRGVSILPVFISAIIGAVTFQVVSKLMKRQGR